MPGCGSKLDYFFENTSLHGFKYLASGDHPVWMRIFNRFFWASFISVSIGVMFAILSRTMNDFTGKTTSINVDTSYREWNNTFPAISICMTKGRSTNKIKDYLQNYWETSGVPGPARPIRFYRAIQSLLFINFHQPLDGINVETCLELNNTCGIDIEITKSFMLPRKCGEFMLYVSFLGKEVNCEDFFKPHETEIGFCFTANSLVLDSKSKSNFDQLPLKHSNLEPLDRSIEIRYKDIEFVIYKLYVHTPEEVPHGSLEGFGLRKAKAHTYFAFKTIEMMNLPGVEQESVEARQCRYPYEYLNEHKLLYSIAHCHFNKRMQRELHDCNCTLPIANPPEDVSTCNITKFECAKQSLDKANSNEGNECTMPSCLAMEIVKVGSYDRDYWNQEYGTVIVDIINMPTLRYIRRVRVTKLDMIGE